METAPTKQIGRRTYTVAEAALLIGVSRSTAYELVARGELRAIRLGRRWVVPVSTVAEIVGDDIDTSK
jgi:excisionase family DNA binding protein